MLVATNGSVERLHRNGLIMHNYSLILAIAQRLVHMYPEKRIQATLEIERKEAIWPSGLSVPSL